MASDYLTDFLLKCTPCKEKNDVILNLLLSYIIKTDKTLSENTRRTYKTLQLIMNGDADPKEIDAESLELIREAYNELLQEMSSVDIDEKAIKSMMDPKAFDGP